MTIEDPDEYRIRGINQIEIQPQGGLTFAPGLRTIPRSDPDLLLVGEIRDEETARMACSQASMTTLPEDGLRLCLEGVSSLDEIRRVTGDRLA